MADAVEPLAALVRAVDDLESRAAGYLTLDDVRSAAGTLADQVERALGDDLLLVDHRERFDAETGITTAVTLCRLNRRHPVVRGLNLG